MRGHYQCEPRSGACKFGACGIYWTIQTGLDALGHNILKFLCALLLFSLDGERRLQQIKLHVVQRGFHDHVIAAVGILRRSGGHLAFCRFNVVALGGVDQRALEINVEDRGRCAFQAERKTI